MNYIKCTLIFFQKYGKYILFVLAAIIVFSSEVKVTYSATDGDTMIEFTIK